MNRTVTALLLAVTVTAGFGTVLNTAPAAHAQTAPYSISAPQTVAIGDTATVSGQGFTPNNWVYIYFQRPDGTTNAVNAQTNSTGQFSITLGFSAAHGTGYERVWAYDYATSRWSAPVSILVTAGAPIPVRQVQLSSTTAAPGTTITVSGQGFTPNSWIYVYFQRPNGTHGAYFTQSIANGTFTSLLSFDAANGCGTESIWAYDYGAQQWSAPATVNVVCGVPSRAPSNLRIVAFGQSPGIPQTTTVTLRWQDNGTDETGFRIQATFTRLYGGTDGQQWDEPANSTTATVGFVAGGINPIKTACFTVSALTGANESAPSNQVCQQL